MKDLFIIPVVILTMSGSALVVSFGMSRWQGWISIVLVLLGIGAYKIVIFESRA